LRIYAAYYIYALGEFDRAIYFDSDIVCNQDISPLVSLPFEENLLLARLEEPSPEIQWATDQHQLAPSSYFNSGVLAFNLSSYDIEACILRAIRISQHKASSLIFHDQCALNFAFANRTKFLEPRLTFLFDQTGQTTATPLVQCCSIFWTSQNLGTWPMQVLIGQLGCVMQEWLE